MQRTAIAMIVGALALTTACSAQGTPATGSSPTTAAAAVGTVDVGGHSLSYSCSGSGSPTVILEHGLGGDATTWDLVAPKVSTHARTCTYSRYKVNPDAPSAGGRTAADAVTDLHALLAAAKIDGPYVLVGFSIGGLISQLYARTYPKDIAGLVLVDSNSADEAQTYWAHLTPSQIAQDKEETGTSNPENFDILASFDLTRAAPAMPDVPLVVVSHTRADASEWPPSWDPATFDALQAGLQTALVKLTSHGRQVLADGAGHNIPDENPAVVVSSIVDVLSQVGAS